MVFKYVIVASLNIGCLTANQNEYKSRKKTTDNVVKVKALLDQVDNLFV